ncbi:Hypothetical_protein [Hexamita inflata]|uniref:Hypothetical_protein n=1 Tax=Hexamita inflata TaxID=28002 RepID=A0AA86NZJ3_9EUKA|nr:Hypothetical protein HINF_LOCUS16180 [Hexamita inflata]
MISYNCAIAQYNEIKFAQHLEIDSEHAIIFENYAIIKLTTIDHQLQSTRSNIANEIPVTLLVISSLMFIGIIEITVPTKTINPKTIVVTSTGTKCFVQLKGSVSHVFI